MANNAVWQTSHFLCIFAHIGMIIVGVVIFVINVEDLEGTMTNKGHTVFPWATAGIGIVGTGLNGFMLKRLLRLQHPPESGSPNEHYHQRKTAFIMSFVIQTTWACADIAIGAAAASQVSSQGNLAALCVVSILTGVVAIATFLADVSQFKEQRKESKGYGIDNVQVVGMGEAPQRVTMV